jgi:phenylalanine-4-hydroxylase
LIFSEYASTIPKNFTARYDPYTESIEILDTKREILKNLRGVSREIRTLSDALDRL